MAVGLDRLSDRQLELRDRLARRRRRPRERPELEQYRLPVPLRGARDPLPPRGAGSRTSGRRRSPRRLDPPEDDCSSRFSTRSTNVRSWPSPPPRPGRRRTRRRRRARGRPALRAARAKAAGPGAGATASAARESPARPAGACPRRPRSARRRTRLPLRTGPPAASPARANGGVDTGRHAGGAGGASSRWARRVRELAVARERRPARQAVEEDAAERIDVGAAVDGAPSICSGAQ